MKTIFLTDFNMDNPIIFIIVGVIIGFVFFQSFFFLFKAIKQGKKIGMKKEQIYGSIKRSAIFAIAPAIAIFVGVVTLTGILGNALPWLRLSVIGSITYETLASGAAMEKLEILQIATAEQYATVAFVMTLGIVPGLFLVPILCKPITVGMVNIKNKNSAWGEIFLSGLFVGMISAFLGFIFCDVTLGLAGWIPVFVMLISALTMVLIGAIIKVTKFKVLEEYAIPISMVVSMLCAIPITNWIM